MVLVCILLISDVRLCMARLQTGSLKGRVTDLSGAEVETTTIFLVREVRDLRPLRMSMVFLSSIASDQGRIRF